MDNNQDATSSEGAGPAQRDGVLGVNARALTMAVMDSIERTTPKFSWKGSSYNRKLNNTFLTIGWYFIALVGIIALAIR